MYSNFNFKMFFIIIATVSISWCIDLEQIVQSAQSENTYKDIPQSYQRKDFSYERNISNSFNSVDEKSYIVGSGDEFTLFFTDLTTIFYNGSINQNEDLIIPGLGSLKIGKITLFEAKNKITDYFLAKSKKTVSVSFSKAKNASITVTGDVENPGTYQIAGTMRILDAIQLANGKLPSLLEFNYRSVEVKSKDTIKIYDLYKFIYCGDLSQNPYVYPSDNITLKPAQHQIYLSGEIRPITGMIPILPNENLNSFLKMFQLTEAADTNNIIVQRIISSKEHTVIKVSLINAQDFLLKDRDIVIISKKINYPDIDIISVSGEVKSPGPYPIIKGATKASDLLLQAGGPTTFGNIKRAVVIRRKKSLPEGINVPAVRPVMTSALASMKLGKDYSIIKLENNDVIVEPEDQIFVPKNDQFVYVSGSVKNPGGMHFQSGKDMYYYIKQAGGFTKRADKRNLSVMTSYDNTVVTKDNGIVEQGDIILVPVSPEEHVFLTKVIPVLSAIATTVGVVLAIYSTTQN